MFGQMDVLRHVLGSAAVLFLCVGGAAADHVRLDGKIGPYSIEMELSAVEGRLDAVTGRYRYAGRNAWLDLDGTSFSGQAYEIEERWNGDLTGRFFLDVEAERMTGAWVDDTQDLVVDLQATTGALDDLWLPPEPLPVSPAETGTYAIGYHWVNSMFAPHYEIGFNGGRVSVDQRGTDAIAVGFDFIVGPTYHIASFRGAAKRTGPRTFTHDALTEYGSGPCHLEFVFGDGHLSITQHSPGFDCGFGARAHAEFDLPKVSDEVDADLLTW